MNLSINKKELETLLWIIPMYESTHNESWKNGVKPEEEIIVKGLIKKLDKINESRVKK